jgi:hypothetical protein
MFKQVLNFFRKVALKKRIREMENRISMDAMTLSSYGGYDDVIDAVLTQAGMVDKNVLCDIEPFEVYVSREEMRRRILRGPATLERMLKTFKQLVYLKQRLSSIERGVVLKKAAPSYATGIPFGISTAEESQFRW